MDGGRGQVFSEFLILWTHGRLAQGFIDIEIPRISALCIPNDLWDRGF